jgi:predicted nucleic acid-binding protein
MRLCLDTDILIDYLRKPSEMVKILIEKIYEGKISAYTTTVNSFEIWLGIFLAPKPHELVKETEGFLSQLEILNLDYRASVEASRTMVTLRKQGQTIEIRDLFVSSISKVNGMPLVTRNIKHYKRIPRLTALTPEEAIQKFT